MCLPCEERHQNSISQSLTPGLACPELASESEIQIPQEHYLISHVRSACVAETVNGTELATWFRVELAGTNIDVLGLHAQLALSPVSRPVSRPPEEFPADTLAPAIRVNKKILQNSQIFGLEPVDLVDRGSNGKSGVSYRVSLVSR